MVTAWSRGARRRWRSPSVSCSARNIGRRATLFPSPRRRSFLPVSASRWRSLSLSGVLLLRLSCWGLWCSFLLCWGWLYMILFYTVFNRARNKRARTREGLPPLFPVSLPSVELLTAFFSGGRCRGIPSTLGKRGGVFLSVFYISGGIVKNLHGHKISTAGGGFGSVLAVLVWASAVVLSPSCALLGASVVSPGRCPGRCPAARGSGPAWRTDGGKWWTGQPSARRRSPP